MILDDLNASYWKCWSDDVQNDRQAEFQLVDSTPPVGGVEWKQAKKALFECMVLSSIGRWVFYIDISTLLENIKKASRQKSVSFGFILCGVHQNKQSKDD